MKKQVIKFNSSLYSLLQIRLDNDNSCSNYIVCLFDSGEMCSYNLKENKMINNSSYKCLDKPLKIFNKEFEVVFINALKYYKKDMFISFSCYLNKIKIWSLNECNSLFTLNSITSNVLAAEVIVETDIMICSLQDGSIQIVNLLSKELIKSVKTNTCQHSINSYKKSKYNILASNLVNKSLIVYKLSK